MSTPHDSIGMLSTSPTGTKDRGKVIDTWTFHHAVPGMKSYSVEVSFRKPQRGVGPDMVFVAMCSALPKFVVRSTDIVKLYEVVDEQLREQSIMSSGIVWEDWLEVITRVAKAQGRYVGHGEFGTTLAIEYNVIKRGRHPDLPGRDYTISSGGSCHAVPFPEPKRAGVDANADRPSGGLMGGLDGYKHDSRSTDAGYAYIQDSPEARAKLDALIAAAQRVGEQLEDFLSQDKIAGAIAAGTGALMLTTPSAN